MAEALAEAFAKLRETKTVWAVVAGGSLPRSGDTQTEQRGNGVRAVASAEEEEAAAVEDKQPYPIHCFKNSLQLISILLF